MRIATPNLSVEGTAVRFAQLPIAYTCWLCRPL